MPTLRDQLRQHHGRDFRTRATKVAKPTTRPEGEGGVSKPEARLVRYDYSIRPIIGKAGRKMVEIAFREVRWHLSGLLLAAEDYARLEGRLVREALEDAYERGSDRLRRAIDNVYLLSSGGIEGGPVWQSAAQEFVRLVR